MNFSKAELNLIEVKLHPCVSSVQKINIVYFIQFVIVKNFNVFIVE
jgi:hypothetical protein